MTDMPDTSPALSTNPNSGFPNTAWTAAQTAWGEARGDGAAGMTAVLNVIGNRVANPGWWGRDIVSVCLAPWQFSCWIKNTDPQSDYAAMQAVTTDDASFAEALSLAEQLVAGTLPDTTGGADSYYAETIAAPYWVAKATFTGKIGGQLFYITRK